MSPRKSHNKVEKSVVSAYKNMGTRMREGPYLCPLCGSETLRIIIKIDSNKVILRCKCDLRSILDYVQGKEAIEYYNDFIDNIR